MHHYFLINVAFCSIMDHLLIMDQLALENIKLVTQEWKYTNCTVATMKTCTRFHFYTC